MAETSRDRRHARLACSGCGTVFSVTPGKVETVVYSFKGSSDGLNPDAGLTNIGGMLYGTTASGGTDFNGTVFVITR